MVPVGDTTPVAAPSIDESEPDEPAAAGLIPVTPAPAPTTAPPVLAPDSAEEPVAAAAAAVAPAVVLLQNDLGQGSGIVYDESGLILTNAHVVGQFTEMTVTLPSGVTVTGRVLGADPNTDVAVVKIDTDAEYGVAALAPLSSVEVGQLAIRSEVPSVLNRR